MTSGENTAFILNREFLISRGFEGCRGYLSDSEVFTHSLHYFVDCLGLGLECYKHGITPLADASIKVHPDRAFLTHMVRPERRGVELVRQTDPLLAN